MHKSATNYFRKALSILLKQKKSWVSAARYLGMAMLLCGSHTGMTQDVKNEVETGITAQDMPEKAMKLLALMDDAGKVRFYYETDGQKTSYECKLLWQGDTYSIEFYEDGSLMDVEKLMKYRTLPRQVRQPIKAYLHEGHQRAKIKKVQQQFSAATSDKTDEEVLKAVLDKAHDALTIRYELEVAIRKGNEVGTYEMLFDQAGQFLRKRKIVRRSLDNILY